MPANLCDIPIEIIPKILNKMDQKSLLQIGATCTILHSKIQKSDAYFDTIILTESRKTYVLSIDHVLEIRFQEFGKLKTKIEYFKNSDTVYSTNIHFESVYEVVVEILSNFLQRIGKRLKNLYIFVNNSMRSKIIRNIKIRNIPNLSRFEIDGKVAQQLDIFKYQFIDFSSVSNVKTALKIPVTPITLEQLINLQAKAIEISLMPKGLTMENLREFVEKWINGKLNENFRKLKISTSRQNQIGRLNLSGLDVRIDENGGEFIQSKLDATKYIGIFHFPSFILIQVSIEKNGEFRVENDVWI